MSKKIDVLIQGAGPAGLVAAAWLARSGRRVALYLRQRKVPLDRIEALGPDIVTYLSQIGLSKEWLSELASPIPGTVSLWAGEQEAEFDSVMSPHGSSWSVRREVFDKALLSYAISQGVELVSDEVAADKVLIAVGSDSAMNGVVNDQLVAITRRYNCCFNEDLRLHIESTPLGWWYALPYGKDALGLGFITDKETIHGVKVSDFWDEATSYSSYGFLNDSHKPGPLRGANVRCAISLDAQDRIGNARVSYDPLTGRGVAESIRNALQVVRSIGSKNEVEQCQDEIDYLNQYYATYIEERQRLYYMGAETYKTGFWQRRLTP